MAAAPLTARRGAHAVWTGREMLIYGGRSLENGPINDGARYDPERDQWEMLPMDGAPSARLIETVVWTGREMILWAGFGANRRSARFDPETNQWTSIPMPDLRCRSSGVATSANVDLLAWTGTDLLVLCNQNAQMAPSPQPMIGYRIDLDTAVATPISTAGAPSKRSWGNGVWTGIEMIVWGWGSRGNKGARYDPQSDTWASLRSDPYFPVRWGHSAVWTGREVIFWGGGRTTGSVVIEGTGPNRFRQSMTTYYTGAQYRPLWLRVNAPTQTYTATMEPLWVAEPGAWYRVTELDGEWGLAQAQGDAPDWQVRIRLDARVQLYSQALLNDVIGSVTVPKAMAFGTARTAISVTSWPRASDIPIRASQPESHRSMSLLRCETYVARQGPVTMSLSCLIIPGPTESRVVRAAGGAQALRWKCRLEP